LRFIRAILRWSKSNVQPSPFLLAADPNTPGIQEPKVFFGESPARSIPVSEHTADQLSRIQIPGRAADAATKLKPTRQLFPDLRVKEAYDIQALSRDGRAAELKALSADKLRGQVVELEFENGEKLWVKGDRLLERLAEEKRREQEIRARSGGAAAGAADEVRLPTVWTLPGVSRGVTGQLILKGLKLIGFDPATSLAKGLKNLGVSYLENQLVEGTLNKSLAELEKGVAFDAASGECSGWLFPLNDQVQPEVAAQIRQARQLTSGEPYLLFLHGTASSSNGSFGKLADTTEWSRLREAYADRILAYEHRTLSASPLKNVLDLLSRLPTGARLHLVSHSRGGLLGELLCLSQVSCDDAAFNELLVVFDKSGADGRAAQEARHAQREMLRRLRDELDKKQLRIERFVRVACPARGTTWLADNLDYFFSALLRAVELVPGLTENPIYDFLKATLTALVQMRREPAELPGLEAMMPASPFIAFLNQPALVSAAALAVIKGDSNIGGSVKSALLTLLTNSVLWEKNDWVVNTRSMDGGLPRQQPAWQFLDEGSDISHFNYFFNPDTRSRLVSALETLMSELPKGFSREDRKRVIEISAAREAAAPGDARGTVFVLPGIMGSELQAGGEEIWLRHFALLRGGMEKLVIGQLEPAVQPSGLMTSDYGRLIQQLSRSYRVEPFAYDWRQSVRHAGEKLSAAVQAALAHDGKPVHFVAHSMGGLVARSLIASYRELWQELVRRQGRLVMLGTPNNGAHAIARLLLGEEKLLKQLALLDFKHSRDELTEIIRAYPGVLDLLPEEYFDPAAWQALQAAAPEADQLAAARKWRNELKKAVDPARLFYVAGWAARTPIKLKRLSDGTLEVTETSQGDGRVPYATGRLENVPTWYAEAIHGDLADEPTLFPAIFDLLEQGRTERLPQQPRADRGGAAVEIITRAREIEPVYPVQEDLYEALNGGRTPPAPVSRATPYTLQLSVMHGHLRYAGHPVAVGHYVNDTIVSAEAQLNRELDDRLKERHSLNLYPGPKGTAEVVYVAPDHQPPGALIVGLGEVGEITADLVTRGVAAAALRYALQQTDLPVASSRAAHRSIGFSPLLIGTYGGHALTVAESVEAIVAGAVQVNHQLQAQGLWERVRIEKVEFVEIYEDVAIQAMHAIHRLQRDGLPGYDDQVTFAVHPPLLVSARGGRYQRPVTLAASDWWRRIQIISVAAEPGASSKVAALPDSLRFMNANPALQKTQQEIISGLVADAAQSADHRAYLTALINHLLAQSSVPGAEEDRLEFTVIGERARVESQQQISRRFWLDQLIEQSVSETDFKPALAATLFELLVPNDLKQQAEPVSLVLDRTAAQYPWELLTERAHPDRPLVTQIGLLRQFKAPAFRPNPQRARGVNVLVVGDTSDHGFAELFGAQEEARQVASALKASQYDISTLIREKGINVLTELFAREYQILHIAAHGAFDTGNAKRQGIVLGPDQYLTVAELDKLRAVPDLVFINCCHLGRIERNDKTTQQQLTNPYPHQLAAGIAEQLITMGVKAVIAAGWAVDDAAALTFATEFYREMLDGERFGDAVLRARQRTFLQHRETNTWGAYQCYGHPGFTLEQAFRISGGKRSSGLYSRREYRDELRSIAQQPEAEDVSRNTWLIERIARLSEELPAAVRDGEVFSDLADAWRNLGQFDKAIEVYEQAFDDCSDKQASLRNIEELANLHCRVVDRQWYAAEAAGGVLEAKQQKEMLQRLTMASERLEWLIEKFARTVERLSLQARVQKSLALIETSQTASARALQRARALYHQASDLSAAGGQMRDNYPTCNWLACELLLRRSAPRRQGREKIAFEALLDESLNFVKARLAEKEDFWVRVAIPDGALLRALNTGSLVAQKEELIAAYKKAFGTGARPHEVDTALSQLDFLRVMFHRQARSSAQKAVVETLREIKVTLLTGVA
jgi:pimeloyl-ACP methyl ester carboxylesterase/tetratricopeptide (TPR) repeat protein